MTISSIGVGSGLDVNSIVTQLVAIEKQPLQTLATKASSYQTQLSVYGNLNSQVSALETAAAALATASGWTAQKSNTSDATVVSVTAGSATVASSMSVDVTQLARAQSSASVGVAAGTPITTAGRLSIQLGSWAGSTFTSSGDVIPVDIAAGDTVTNIASKINAANAGVTATVLKDGANERLVVTSKNSGAAAGFNIQTDAALGTDLAKFAFESATVANPLAVTSAGVVTGTPATAATAVAGTLSIRVGSWNDPAFAAGTSTAVDVSIAAGDTVAQIKDKFNAANSGVTAAVDSSTGEDRLVFSYAGTGEAAGFRIDTPLGTDLSKYKLSAGAVPTTRTTASQSALDANVKINGVAITSASNNIVDVTPGVTIKLNKLGSSDITVEQDKDAIQTKVQAFADAYSALSKTLADSTKYVAGGTSGPLQGDSTTLGIQTLLRNTLFATSGTGDTAPRLSDIGLELQKDGSLKLNTTKLTTKMSDMTNLQKLFTQANTGQSDNGFGIKFKTFAHNLLNASSGSSALSSGTLVDKKNAIQGSINRNLDDQDRVNARASMVEAALRKQYSALDVQMSKMSALGSYVTAQLAQWNKTA